MKNKKRLVKSILLIVIMILFLAHLIFVFVPLISKDKGINKYGFSAFNAVKYNEEAVNNKLKLTVVWANKTNKYNVGDLVLVKINRTGNKEYWVEEIMEITDTNIKLKVSDLDTQGHIVNKDELVAKYVKDANLLQKIYYVNIQWLGFVLASVIELGITVLIFYGKFFKGLKDL